MQALQNESEQPFHELSDLLEAELEYHARCKEILEELRDTWPSGYVGMSAFHLHCLMRSRRSAWATGHQAGDALRHA